MREPTNASEAMEWLFVMHNNIADCGLPLETKMSDVADFLESKSGCEITRQSARLARKAVYADEHGRPIHLSLGEWIVWSAGTPEQQAQLAMIIRGRQEKRE